jgi:hypothetical protein
MQLTQDTLKSICEDSGGEVEFRNSYSGRGMYGSTCVGIVGSMSDCMVVIGEVIKSAEGNPGFEDTVDQLLSFSTDSMGRDVILYWEDFDSLPEDIGYEEEEIEE